jgi:ketosteroid isomerase-like protein
MCLLRRLRTAYTCAMRIQYALFFCCSLGLFVASGCSRQASDEATIRGLDAQWSKTAGAHDLDGIVSYYSDDAVLLPPNAPAAASKEAIRASWAPLAAPGVSLSWQASKVEVAKSGDLAYSTGTYALAMKDPQGKPVADKGKFMEVWKRQPDGGWKAVADTYNSDLAAQP